MTMFCNCASVRLILCILATHGVAAAAVHQKAFSRHLKKKVDGCDRKLAVYHLDAMWPFGFGCQYNHLIQFMAIAMLEGRVPVLRGPWTLGCPGDDQQLTSMQEEVNASDEFGFDPCYLSIAKAEGAKSCPISPVTGDTGYASTPSKYSEDLRRSADFRHDNLRDEDASYNWMAFADDMLRDKDAQEWHFDGDVIASFAQVGIDCPSAKVNFGSWEPPASDEMARKVCKESGKQELTRVDLYRYVAQKYAPFSGSALVAMNSAKADCAKQAAKAAGIDGGTRLAIHVRRGDKVIHEDRAYDVKEYIDAARAKGWTFDSVFIATDDPETVKKEAEHLKLNYFMLDARPDGWDKRGSTVATMQFLSELACLADADYFVGTSGSNVARVVQTLRSKEVDTGISTSGEVLPVGA